MATDERFEKISRVLSQRQPTLSVVMENIFDPHNVAAIMRSADAVGVMEVNLVYDAEAFPDFNVIGKQSSAGARKWVGTPNFTSIAECYASLRAHGIAIYASRLDASARPLYDLDLAKPAAFVFGNERQGVSDEAASLADATYIIPMAGMVQSLNVSVAAAVTLYEAYRQRRAKGMYSEPQLPPEELERLLAQWRYM